MKKGGKGSGIKGHKTIRDRMLGHTYRVESEDSTHYHAVDRRGDKVKVNRTQAEEVHHSKLPLTDRLDYHSHQIKQAKASGDKVNEKHHEAQRKKITDEHQKKLENARTKNVHGSDWDSFHKPSRPYNSDAKKEYKETDRRSPGKKITDGMHYSERKKYEEKK